MLPLVLGTFFCFTAQAQKRPKHDPLRHTQFDGVVTDTIFRFFYQPETPENPVEFSVFTSLDDFPSSWTGLSKCAQSFCIYHTLGEFVDEYRTLSEPIDEVKIENDTLKNIDFQETMNWPVREFRKVSDFKYYFGLAADTNSDIYARCTFEILDADTMYTIQSVEILKRTKEGEEQVGQYSGLYVPDFKKYLFSHHVELDSERVDCDFPNEKFDLERFKQQKLLIRDLKDR